MTQDAGGPDAGHGGSRRGASRVSQVYLGAPDMGPAADRLRGRIDWLAGLARGPRVLDVGCGDGILGLLLARRGISVTGVDVDSEAIGFAVELLAEEPDEVRERVELVQGDFASPGPVEGRFDSVILGDVLGCFDDPGAMLDRCLAHLVPGGQVVITAPLGVESGDDRRPPLRLTDMIELLKPRFALDTMEVEAGDVRFTGSLTEDRESSWDRMDPQAVLMMTEAAFAEAQNRAYGLERQLESDRMALSQHKIAASQFKKGLDAKSGELRVLRHRLQGLQAVRSSTSFVVGSAMVRAAKQPRLLWRLPFQLLRLYRSASRRASNASGENDPDARYQHLPKSMGLDISKFVSYPPFPIPEAKSDGPRVAAILDTFTAHSLRYEVDLLLLSWGNWRAEIDKARPKLLLVESAWVGNGGEWRNRIVGSEGLEDKPLGKLLEHCRTLGIPTAFWNKEDPPHFDEFIGAAREFDLVFTTDADCLPLYREALGHDRVYVLPFAAQPRLHNPSREEGWPRYPVCFAGSWVQHKYPERAEALRHLLDPSLPMGLHIFDRNLEQEIDLGPNFRFPERYNEAIKGTLSYEEMLTAYRCYDVMLNVNTVTESPTMFSRRVLESLGCGTPVVSSESVGMSRMLGENVRVARSSEETVRHLVDLLGDEEARVREGHLAYRHVHENHTYRHRIDEVFVRAGLGPIDPEQPAVSVLMPTMRPSNVTRCLENFAKQSYPRKELILILNNAEFDIEAVQREAESVPNVQVLYVDGRTTIGDCLNRGVEAASGKYIAKMDDDDHYGERYLSDSVLAASFSNAEIVGKGLLFVYFEAVDATALFEWTSEHTFMSFVTGGTLFVQADVAKDIPFDSVSLREDTNFQRSAVRAGCRIYSADRFNYIRVRHQGLSGHSDRTPDASFLQRCRAQTPGLGLGRALI